MNVAGGGNWAGYYLPNHPPCMPTQRMISRKNNTPIHFGLGSLGAFLPFFLEKTSQTLTVTAVRSIIDDIEILPKAGYSSEGDRDFKLANHFLDLAESAKTEKVKKSYLKEAELTFQKAANTQPYQILKAPSWIAAALCAKTGHEDQGIVDSLCEKAETALNASREEILMERAQLIKPDKLTDLSRLFFSTPIIAVLAPIYRCSRPGSWTSQQARAYLIKISYGQDEWKRVQQNENLAKKFNGSRKLWETIAILRTKEDKDKSLQGFLIDPIEPIEVPLFDDYSGLRANNPCLNYGINKAVVPYSPRNIPKTPEDMV